MEEVGKLKKIYKGFFPDEEVSDEVKTRRRDLCGACEYNSSNTKSEDLSTIDYLRSQTVNPFCTICKCQILEKTQSPLEECAMGKIGLSKKWLKTVLETKGNETLNIRNSSGLELDLQVENGKFIIDYNVLTLKSDTNIELELYLSNSNALFKIHSVNPSCGCTATKFKTEDNIGFVNLRINLNSLSEGRFSKLVTIEYLINKTPYTAKFLLRGFLQTN